MSSSRKVSRVGLEFIKGYEGFRAHAARLPNGRWTIGHGHVTPGHPGGEIDRGEAERLLVGDLEPIERLVGELVETPLTQSQFDALSSLAFNIGPRHFLLSGLVRHINDDRFADAAALFDVWRRARVDGRLVVVEELVRRRAAERALFLSSADGPTPAPRAEVVPVADPDAVAGAPKQTPQRVRIDFDDELAVAAVAPSNSARDTGQAADRAVERMRRAWPQSTAERVKKDRLEDEISTPVASAADRAIERLRSTMATRPVAPVVRPLFNSAPKAPAGRNVGPFVCGSNALAIEPAEDVENEMVVAPAPQPVLLTCVDASHLDGHNSADQLGEHEEEVIDHPDGPHITCEPIVREPDCDMAEVSEREPAGRPRTVEEAVARLHAIVPELAEGDGEAVAPLAFDESVEPIVDEVTFPVGPVPAARDLGDDAIWSEPEPSARQEEVIERLAAVFERQPQADLDEEMWRQVVESAQSRVDVPGSGGGAAVLGLVGAVMAAGGSFELAQFTYSAPSSAESTVWMTFAVTGAMAMASSVFLLGRRWLGERA